MGQDAGCHFAGKSRKKCVTPLHQFTVESSQIDELNGSYNQGHEFVLDGGAIQAGDQIIVRIIDFKRFDIDDLDIEYSGDGNAYTSFGSDSIGKYAKIIFDRGSEYLTLEVFIIDYYTNNLVTLFKLKTV